MMRPESWRQVFVCFAAAAAAFIVFFTHENRAQAVPSYARKYQASCQTCHTVFPVLNSFGEAFRRDGYRFPSQNGSVDSDAVKANMIPMGQEEYEKTFPDSVLPDKIAEAIPLGVMVNGGVALTFPNSDAHDATGNTFTWNGIVREFHLFGAGSFTDRITYFSQVTISGGGADIETGYLLFNDLAGPNHLLNLWVGRLMNPQLTSFGLHGSYLNDSSLPAVSVAGLYNPNGAFVLGQGHSDGIELNGIAEHRIGYAIGWLASMPPSSTSGLKVPDAEDVYAHVGVKLGGVSLDGEGGNGTMVADAKKPWAETSVTLDAFAYHGLGVMDNGVNAPTPTAQRDPINAVGGAIRIYLDSLVINSGLQLEKHMHPYPGSAPTAANPPGQPNAVPGDADLTGATSYTQYNEINYIVFPWLVPGIRSEFTRVNLEGGTAASLLRIIPGVAMLVRPNIKLILTADFERAHGLPASGAWGPAGGAILAPTGGDSKFEAEQVNATFAWAY